MLLMSRRRILEAGGAAAITSTIPTAQAQQAGDTLARLRAAGVAKVGIANQAPFSSLNPDGTMSGVAPSIAQRVLERLGIKRMEGAIASYGDLIPGMMAGRWDFVAASLTITKERCAQVLYSDPLSFDGACIVAIPEKNTLKPKTMADIVRIGVPVGAQQGGAQYRQLRTKGMSDDNIRQFTNDNAMFDALMAGRVQYLWASHQPMTEIIRRRRANVEVVFPVPDAPAPGAGNAFRLQDVEFHAAFQKELRALKASGEYLAIANKFGFEIPPELIHATGEGQCKLVSQAS
jgi:polar amino acid transport system substrate-binding protein